MKKKILISLGVIVFAAAVIIGATGAFFSDTETSTGNTFTAGSIDLKVDSTQHYNGMICEPNTGVGAVPGTYWWRHVGNNTPATWPVEFSACDGTWALKDLVPTSDKFFNFTDVKPGDSGENTISLHVDNNTAYACADLTNIHNDDNSCTSPEAGVGAADPECSGTPGALLGANSKGELGQGLDFLIWNDTNGNNIWDQGEVGTHSKGAPLTNQTYTLADSTGAPIPATGNSYLGLAWCAGTFTSFGPAVAPVCDGTAMGNEAQTDSYKADIGLRVVQARNNAGFKCTPPVVGNGPTIGALVVVPPAATCDVTVNPAAAITAGHAQTINGGIADATTGQTVCVVPGTYPEDVVINKSITLDGTAGAATTIINGQTTGQGVAVKITAANVTLEGFSINGAGISALFLDFGVTGANVHDNHIKSATGPGTTGLVTEGDQNNDTFTNNQFTGVNADQIAYVNGDVSLATHPSNNVDFIHNTFDGTIVAGGEALGNESTNSNITQNVFKSTITSTYAIAETFKADTIFSQNNFDGAGGVKVKNSAGSGTVNAQNNWWGAAAPSGNIAGLVDDSLKALVAFLEN